MKQQNLTAEQLQQQAIDEANAEKEKYQKMANKLEVEKVLITAGMQEDDYKDFIDGIVTSDKDASVSVATAMATTFKTKMAAAEAQAKNDQLKIHHAQMAEMVAAEKRNQKMFSWQNNWLKLLIRRVDSQHI